MEIRPNFHNIILRPTLQNLKPVSYDFTKF